MIRKRLTEGRLPDTHLIGKKLFTDYNFPLQVIAVLLLVATIGCVTLSKRSSAAPTVVKDQLAKQKEAKAADQSASSKEKA